MRLSCLGLLFSAFVCAQSVNLSLSPTSGQPGTSAVLTAAFSDTSTSSNIVGFQWALGSIGGTQGSYTVPATSTKTLWCAPATCILIGVSSTTPPTLNNTTIPSGSLFSIPITIPAGTAPSTIVVQLTGLLAVNSSSVAVPVTSNSVNLTVLGPTCDLNGDGVCNAADVQIAIAMFRTGTCTGPFSLVGDGKCNLIDLVTEILSTGTLH